MKRIIPSVFQYNDYSVLLNADYTKRSQQNNQYSLRSYARDLKLSPGYISSVLRGKKNFNTNNFKDIFLNLGFKDDQELDYIQKLIIYKTSKNQLDRTEALNYIKSHYESLELKDKSDCDILVKSSHHLIIYMLIEKISNLNKAKKVAETFGVSQKQFNEVLLDLIENDFVRNEGPHFFVTENNIAITNNERIFDCARELSSQLFTSMKSQGGISFPKNSTHSLILGFNESSFKQAIEVYKQFLHEIYRISKNSKDIDRISIFSDILMTTPLGSPENN